MLLLPTCSAPTISSASVGAMFSFAFLIIAGATLLELPNATTSPISLVDALSTSTSAICVTGLIVVDTATQFTALGKSIILLLIQIGGIGIMTFTSFFGFFFKAGSSSFSERFVLSEFLSEDNVSEIRKTLAKVVLITLIFEAIGAAFLYFNLDKELFDNIGSRVRFSVFHSVSAFCNAGFGLYSDSFSQFYANFNINTVITLLIIFGGLGFPVLRDLFSPLKLKQRLKEPWKDWSLSTKIAVYTSLVLVIFGTVSFYFLHVQHLKHISSPIGKFAASFFQSVNTRTSGFNSINMAELSNPLLILNSICDINKFAYPTISVNSFGSKCLDMFFTVSSLLEFIILSKMNLSLLSLMIICINYL